MKDVSETQPATPDDAVRVLKIGRCPSLSEKSELGYEVGVDASTSILFRVVSNSGNGRFNSIWVSLTDIGKLLNQKGSDPITSRVLHPLFQGKSSNTPAFVFAALKAEGLVIAGEEKDSGYLLGDIEGFKKAVSDFAVASTDLSVPTDTYSPASKARPRKPKEA
jgi:hypothetical protein